MCRFASFKHNPKLVEVVVADWFSHGRTEKLTDKTEKTGWYDGHYLPNGTVECRIPDETGRDLVMADWVKRQWPTFVDFIAWAVKNGADVNARDDDDGATALHVMAERGDVDVTQQLVVAGADVNARTDGGQTALICASFNGCTEAVRLLIAARADLNVQNEWGRTALMRAAYFGHVDIVRLLIDAGAYVNLRDSRDQTALHKANVRPHLAPHQEIVDMLKTAGAVE